MNRTSCWFLQVRIELLRFSEIRCTDGRSSSGTPWCLPPSHLRLQQQGFPERWFPPPMLCGNRNLFCQQTTVSVDRSSEVFPPLFFTHAASLWSFPANRNLTESSWVYLSRGQTSGLLTVWIKEIAAQTVSPVRPPSSQNVLLHFKWINVIS